MLKGGVVLGLFVIAIELACLGKETLHPRR